MLFLNGRLNVQTPSKKIKVAILESATLAFVADGLPFIVDTDACLQGLGAVLSQNVDGVERPISFLSRSLAPAEKNYTVTELECLAIVFALKQFRPYLDGQPIIVRTDHRANSFMLKSAALRSGRLSRWKMEIQDLNILEIQYRKGSAHSNADGLSRNPLESHILTLTSLPAELKILQQHDASLQPFSTSSKLASGNEIPVVPPSVDPTSKLASDCPEYEVQAITGHRRKGAELQYRVKWLGYPRPTWETASNLTNCQELLDNYNRTLVP
jgi:hypothetical protein